MSVTRLRAGLLVTLLVASLTAQADDFARLRELRAAARAAYDAEDYASFLARTRESAELFPDSPAVLYNLACGLALTGQAEAAFEKLERLLRMQLHFDVAADGDFAALKDKPAFESLRTRFEALRAPQGQARRALRLPEKDLITEGLAHDPKSGDWFVSSVHKRKVVRVGKDGRARDFVASRQDGLYAALALKLDPQRRLLWVASSAVAEMEGYLPADEGRAALFAFALDTGKLVRRLEAPGPKLAHNFNDLALDARGTLYLSDAVSGQIWRLPPDGKELEELVPAGRLASPQGLVLSADARVMFVADYSRGLFRLELANGALQPVSAPHDLVLAGIDGLVADGRGGLVAIQNGIAPHRVVRLALDAAGTRVESSQILALGLPEMNEPTLGERLGDELYFVANSQWGSFDKGRLWPMEKLCEPIVLAVKLP